jgi:tRNA-2-methylthio-N6-dimethylallyladenosine synthase
MIAKLARGEGRQLEADFPALEKFDSLVQPSAARTCAFLTVQEGCDKFCTFCVVPYTRGPEQSRAPEAVLAEARILADAGAREIVLLGQNVNAYRGIAADGAVWSLARLCGALAGIEQVARIRYTTSHPRDMAQDLIAAHGENQKLMPYLHLPVQSGSDTMLAAMNRRHSAAQYLRLIDRIRAARPDIALTSDFIVGYPGESDSDFEATMDLVRAVKFAGAYSFKYSRRPGTPAAAARKQVPDDVKTARLGALQKLLLEQQDAFNDAQTGRILPVLFDKPGRNENQIVGRTPYLQPVHVQADAALIGRVADVRIAARTANSLKGVHAGPRAIPETGVALDLKFPSADAIRNMETSNPRHQP